VVELTASLRAHPLMSTAITWAADAAAARPEGLKRTSTTVKLMDGCRREASATASAEQSTPASVTDSPGCAMVVDMQVGWFVDRWVDG
jgi:hypothetical protein